MFKSKIKDNDTLMTFYHMLTDDFEHGFTSSNKNFTTKKTPKPTFTCSKLAIETLEQGVKLF